MKRDISAFGHTRPIAQSKAAVVERVERIVVVLLAKSMAFSFPRKTLEPRMWSCRKVVIDSME